MGLSKMSEKEATTMQVTIATKGVTDLALLEGKQENMTKLREFFKSMARINFRNTEFSKEVVRW